MYLCHIWCAVPPDELFTKKTISRTISGTKQQTWVPLGAVKIRTRTCIPPTFNFARSYLDWYHLILLDSSSGEQEPTEISFLEHSEKWTHKQTCANIQLILNHYTSGRYFICHSYIRPTGELTYLSIFARYVPSLLFETPWSSEEPSALCCMLEFNIKPQSVVRKKNILGNPLDVPPFAC